MPDKKKISPRLEDAIKIMVNCSRDNGTYQFINVCDLTINSVETNNIPYFIKYIIT